MENEKLVNWMNVAGYSNAVLATKLGVGREVVWAYAVGKRPISDKFKWLFAQHFGVEAASQVFGLDITISPEPEPVTK